MESFLGVPIVAGDRSLGNLYLTNKIGGETFTAADQEVVEMLAAHAAIAIQNARLYEQVGRLAVLEERTRIGMDLHDGIIQSIYAVGLTLESARLTLEEDVAEADVLLERAVETLNETIRDIRNFILDLRPQRYQGSLDEGLARLVREFQANSMVLVQLDAPPEAVRGLPTGMARALFLTTQEALANVARHARANQVKITLGRQETEVLLTIEDDGRGFETAAMRQSVGHGLANMRARAEELSGRFTIHTESGQGTTLQLKLPLPH
jgi:signal transduction histidine kinase